MSADNAQRPSTNLTAPANPSSAPPEISNLYSEIPQAQSPSENPHAPIFSPPTVPDSTELEPLPPPPDPQSTIPNPQSAIETPYPHGPALWPLRPIPTEQNCTNLNTQSNNSPDTNTANDIPPDPNSPNTDLTDRQQTAISLLLAGHTSSAVAAILAISRTTLYNWKRQPTFLAQLTFRQHEVRRASDARLRLLMLQSTQTALDSLHVCQDQHRFKHAFRLLTLLRPYLPFLDTPEPQLPAHFVMEVRKAGDAGP